MKERIREFLTKAGCKIQDIQIFDGEMRRGAVHVLFPNSRGESKFMPARWTWADVESDANLKIAISPIVERILREQRSTIRVIKAADRPKKTLDDYQTEHEKALLRLLAKKHPDFVRELTVDDIF